MASGKVNIAEEVKEERKEEEKIEKVLKSLKLVSWFALAVGLVAILIGTFAILSMPKVSSAPTGATTTIPTTSANTSKLAPIIVNGTLITPSMSLPDAPVITENQSFGSRLTNINAPLNSSELAVFNNASDSYFEQAGMMLLNGSIDGVGVQPSLAPMLIVNGKPSVIYLGSISCLYCSENKWAMALALGRFGKFGALFKGYSSFSDFDLPTIYWAPAEYNSSGAADFGAFYNSNYINFIAIDYSSQIKDGFAMQPLSYFISKAQSTGSAPYVAALQLISSLNNFQGTPYTIWGKFVVPGADAVDLGDVNPTQPPVPLEYMTHEQVLAQLANPSNKFAWREYAAADLYIAMTCASINNAAPICSLPAIQKIESISHYQ
ncbi:MAG: DUF929 family protein [Candidatus Micrarchaeia archaeon]|jgi:hypothetical protein